MKEEIKNIVMEGKINVSEIILFKSTLTPHGPIYEVIYESMLKAN